MIEAILEIYKIVRLVTYFGLLGGTLALFGKTHFFSFFYTLIMSLVVIGKTFYSGKTLKIGEKKVFNQISKKHISNKAMQKYETLKTLNVHKKNKMVNLQKVIFCYTF